MKTAPVWIISSAHASRAIAHIASFLLLGAPLFAGTPATHRWSLAPAAPHQRRAAVEVADTLGEAKQAWDEVVVLTYKSLLQRLDESEDKVTRQLAGPTLPSSTRDAAQLSLTRIRDAREHLLTSGEWPASLEDCADLAATCDTARSRVDAAYERAIKLALVNDQADQQRRLELGREMFSSLRGFSPWTSVTGVQAGPSLLTAKVYWSPLQLSHPLPAAFLARITVTRSKRRGGLALRLLHGEDPLRLIHLPPELLAASQKNVEAEPAVHHLRVLFVAGTASVELEGEELWVNAVDGSHLPTMEAIDRIEIGTSDPGTRVEFAQCEFRSIWSAAGEKQDDSASSPELETAGDIATMRTLSDGAILPTAGCITAMTPVRAAVAEFEAKIDTLSRSVMAALDASLHDAATSDMSIPQLQALKERTRLERQLFECRATIPPHVPAQLQAELDETLVKQGLHVHSAYDLTIKSCDPVAEAACVAGLKDALADFMSTEHLAPWWNDQQVRALVSVGSDPARNWSRAGSSWISPGLLPADGARPPFVLSGELPLEFVCDSRLSLSGEARRGLAISLTGAFGSWEIPLAGPQIDACLPGIPIGQPCSIALRIILKRSRVTIEVESQRVWCEAITSTSAGADANTPTAGVTLALRGAEPSARFNVEGLRLKAIRSRGAPRIPPPVNIAGVRAVNAALPTSATSGSVIEGVRWLLRHQNPDGSWAAGTLDDRCCNADNRCWPEMLDSDKKPMLRKDHYDEGLTGLSVLALLGAVRDSESHLTVVDMQTGTSYDIDEAVARALTWLRHRQREDGSFVSNEFTMYNQALAAEALCEACRLYKNGEWDETAQGAIDFIVRAQKPNPNRFNEHPQEAPIASEETGRQAAGLWGWRYRPLMYIESQREGGELEDAEYAYQLHDADTSVTTWCIMALRSAQVAGLEVPQECLAGALDFIHWVAPTAKTAANQFGLVGYLDPAFAGQTVTGPRDYFTYYPESMSALGMCSRALLERASNDPFMEAAAKRIVIKPPTEGADQRSIDYYYWYYGTLALCHFDGPGSRRNGSQYWRPWVKELTKTVLKLQNRADKKPACSRGGWLTLDRWAYAGGPIYTTAISLLALEATLSTPVAAQGEERGSEAAAAPR